MPKFLVQFSYTGEGLKGLVKEGGSKRREVIEQLVEIMGGKLEAYYFAYGEYDGIAIVDGRDQVSHVAGILAINGSGVVKTKTTVLITPEEIDQAVKKIPSYRPPGE
ncbi:MAG: GYD domain protein [Candidatus Aminicenantes bacterium RBG_16_63_16]|nr:MAG: GYD domain protein [Candidatus Aminicenantes bacterium RBG_16_63_16]